jgi:hypothetical protein
MTGLLLNGLSKRQIYSPMHDRRLALIERLSFEADPQLAYAIE